MLDGRRGAEALLLCPSSPAGFRGDGLITILTFGPVVAATPPRTTMIQNFGGDGLSHYGVWFELHQADFFMV